MAHYERKYILEAQANILALLAVCTDHAQAAIWHEELWRLDDAIEESEVNV